LTSHGIRRNYQEIEKKNFQGRRKGENPSGENGGGPLSRMDRRRDVM